jgi:hypothetical protein
MFGAEKITSKLEKIERTLKEQDNAMFGYWDMDTGERKLGIIERLEALGDRFDAKYKLEVWVGGPLLLVLALKALGVPLQDISTVVSKLITAIAVH